MSIGVVCVFRGVIGRLCKIKQFNSQSEIAIKIIYKTLRTLDITGFVVFEVVIFVKNLHLIIYNTP